MLKIDEITNAISLTKGDSAELEVKVVWNDGSERGVLAGETLKLTVKPSSASTPVSITKTSSTGIFKLVPNDTSALAVGSYVYDIDLTTSAGDVYTIIPITTFTLTPEVS